MQETREKKGAPTMVWVITLVCVAAIIFALCGGAAYAGVRQSRWTAAKASIGHIEAVLFLAERQARDGGLASPGSFSTLLKSYDTSEMANLPEYERTVLEMMLQNFGSTREFDFAITRFEDGSGTHTQVYYFPVRGRNSLKSDRYYLLSNGVLTEFN